MAVERTSDRSAAVDPADLAGGPVTFLFTDIEGSTRLFQRLGDAYHAVLAAHHRILRAAIASAGGREISTEGDAFFAIFRDPAAGLSAAVRAQRELATGGWPEGATVRVRMGLHTGTVSMVGGELVGLDIHRAARIAAAAHGGQVVLSDATRVLVAGSLADGLDVRDLGEHRLKDLDRAVRIWQVEGPGLAGTFPPLRSLGGRWETLPSALTSFVGRDDDVDRVVALLDGARLVTLTGPGGTGKTRLATEAARAMLPRLADGAAFVSLAPITDPMLVPTTIRATLGLPEDPGRPSTETLVEALRGRDLLLVLDNLEQVLEAAPSIAELLARTERLRVLATSRAGLHVAGEQEYPVAPLDAPAAAAAGDAVARSPAVRLFVDRARAVRPDFALDPSTEAAVAEICRRLDGLPLAIELAAARVRVLGPAAILERLGRGIDLLASPGGDRPDRQRTLRAAIDWSHGLLDGPSRALFRRLAVFVGGFELEDAERIVADPALEAVPDVLEGVSALLDQSLVRRGGFGDTRFVMLETLREYGHEQLVAAGELAALEARHGEHYLALAVAAEGHLTSADPTWLDRLEREHDNLRAALSWAVAAGQVDLGLGAAGALWRFWHLRGHLREGRRRLEEVTGALGPGERTEARASALSGLGGIAYWQGDYDAAAGAYEAALDIRRGGADRPGLARALFDLGFLSAIRRDYDAAEQQYRESIDLYTAAGDELGAATASFGLAFVPQLRGRDDVAVPALEVSLARLRDLDEGYWVLNSELVLSRSLVRRGDLDRARELIASALQRVVAGGSDPSLVAFALWDAAGLAGASGDHERAVRLSGAVSALREAAGGGAPTELVMVEDPLPSARAALGDEAAERLLAEGRSMTRDEAVGYAAEGLAQA